MRNAAKPIDRQCKGDRLKLAECRRRASAPVAPELVLGGASLQEVREFVDIVQLQVSAQQVPHQVKRAIREHVHGIERGKRKRPDLAHTSPFPESFQFVDLDSFDVGAPKSIM